MTEEQITDKLLELHDSCGIYPGCIHAVWITDNEGGTIAAYTICEDAYASVFRDDTGEFSAEACSTEIGKSMFDSLPESTRRKIST